MLDYHLKGSVKTVPHTFGRISVNLAGFVFDRLEKKSLSPIVKDGVIKVNLPISLPHLGLDDDGMISLSRLVALSFKPLYIDRDEIPRIKLLAVDGDINNIDPENLVWKYPVGGLESTLYPGWFHSQLVGKYGKKPVDVKIVSTGEVKTFEQAKDFINSELALSNGLTKKMITVDLRYDKQREIKDLVYKYADLPWK